MFRCYDEGGMLELKANGNREGDVLAELWLLVLQVCKKLTHCKQVIRLMNVQKVVVVVVLFLFLVLTLWFCYR